MLSVEPEPSHQITANERPAKRVKTDHARQVVDPADTNSDITRRHPLGVRPSGNAYLSRRNLRRATGGFYRLPDELLVQILELLDAKALLCLGSCCKALHAFTRSEDLWRALFTE